MERRRYWLGCSGCLLSYRYTTTIYLSDSTLQVLGSFLFKCKDLQSLLAQLQDQRPPTVTGDREEDPAKTGPRICIRVGSIFILPSRKRRTRPLQWPGVRPPDVDPSAGGERLTYHQAASSQKTKPGSKDFFSGSLSYNYL